MKNNKSELNPPRLGSWLLESFCSYDFLSTALWDLHELYEADVGEKGKVRADLRYLGRAIGVIFYLYFKGKSHHSPNRIAMLKNNFVLSFRNFKKDQAYSIINTLGLTIGLTAFILISMFVKYELSYDKFHDDYESIHRLTHLRYHPSGSREFSRMSYSVAASFADQIPEIEAFTRVGNFGDAIVKYGDIMLNQRGGYYVEDNFFQLFNFRTLNGNVNEALKDPKSIIITELMAKKYFGEKNPLGEVLVLNKNKLYQVEAIVEDPPKNSQFQFQFLVSLSSVLENFDNGSWIRAGGLGFLKFDPKKKNEVLAKMDKVKNEFFPESYTDPFAKEREWEPSRFNLQPIADVHLKSKIPGELSATGDMRYMYIFSVIGLVILIIACVNYTNTAVARSIKRSKEVGVRKVIGASKGALIRLYLSETFLYVLVSVILSVMLIVWLLPDYNQFLDRELSISDLSIEFIALMLAIIIAVTFLSGFYPAIFLSRVSVVKALKGQRQKARGAGLKKALITFQFVIAQTLIIATIMIQSQINYLQNKDLGYDREQLIYIPTNGELDKNYEAFKDDVSAIPGVMSSSYIYNLFASGEITAYPLNHFEGLEEEGDENVWANFYQVQLGFIETMRMEIVEGADFERVGQRGIIINQALARKIGWENPVGKVIKPQKGSPPSALPTPVVGVVRDFNDQSLKSEIKPMIMMVGSEKTPYYYLVARLNSESVSATIASLEKAWQKYVPDRPFEFDFYSERLGRRYEAEMRLGKMLSVFTTLAIVISILGILGLSTFMVEQRMREFCIRKVLGASIRQLMTIINRSFVFPIILSFLVAAPLAYYWSAEEWLSSFVYRVEIQPWFFVLAIVGVLFLTLLTVSYHSLKIRKVNPTRHLNSE